ncbi:MAG: hypothetical protein ABIP95_09645 [Pelobium sp.]
MNQLQTDHPIALSLLLNEEIYSVPEEQVAIKKNIPVPVAPIKIEATVKEEIIPLIPVKKSFEYLGDNNKYLLIVVNEPSVAFLKKDDLGFLLKIMAAKKLELADVAIINLHKNEGADYTALKDFFGFNKIITFGINPKILKIDSAVANKKSVYNNTPILGTWDLNKLQIDQEKKTIFWNELKTF